MRFGTMDVPLRTAQFPMLVGHVLRMSRPAGATHENQDAAAQLGRTCGKRRRHDHIE